jgi:pilus assembly protein Flp/PilA
MNAPRRISESRFVKEQSGATSVEYAVMLALILMTLIVGVRTVGNGTNGIWANNQSKLEEAGF